MYHILERSKDILSDIMIMNKPEREYFFLIMI